MFGAAIDYAPVTIRRRKFFPFQPRTTVMTPRGHLHFHPASPDYCDDLAAANVGVRGLFIHEMTHVWQAQRLGAWFLVLFRHPLARYDYALRPGWTLERYGLEQQAEIVRHAWLLRTGHAVRGVPDKAVYDELVRFPGATL